MDFKSRYQYSYKSDLLGRGGFATVYRANDTLLNRIVALKFFTSGNENANSLIKEIGRAIELDHPNLCRYYDANIIESINLHGVIETTEVGVLEYLDLGDIKRYCQNNAAEIDKLLIDVLKGLSYLHSRGIIHRDLKPQNILIASSNDGPIAKITDFGISRNINAGNTNASQLMGTVEYMAPEQFSPAKYGINGRISTNLDLWSFGLLIYELLTGETMFGGRGGQSSAEQVMSNILNENILEEKINNIAEQYRPILKRCLIKDAKERVQTADELINLFVNQNDWSSDGDGSGETKPIQINKNFDQEIPVDEGSGNLLTGLLTTIPGDPTTGKPTNADISEPPALMEDNSIDNYQQHIDSEIDDTYFTDNLHSVQSEFQNKIADEEKIASNNTPELPNLTIDSGNIEKKLTQPAQHDDLIADDPKENDEFNGNEEALQRGSEQVPLNAEIPENQTLGESGILSSGNPAEMTVELATQQVADKTPQDNSGTEEDNLTLEEQWHETSAKKRKEDKKKFKTKTEDELIESDAIQRSSGPDKEEQGDVKTEEDISLSTEKKRIKKEKSYTTLNEKLADEGPESKNVNEHFVRDTELINPVNVSIDQSSEPLNDKIISNSELEFYEQEEITERKKRPRPVIFMLLLSVGIAVLIYWFFIKGHTDKSQAQRTIVATYSKDNRDKDYEYAIANFGDTTTDFLSRLLKSSKNGNNLATAKLAAYYFGMEQYEEFIGLAKELAAKGVRDSSVSQANVTYATGMLCYDKKDFTVAKNWFIKSDTWNNGMASCMIGNMYFQGQGVTRNINAARQWYIRSANKQNVVAFYALGLMFANGDGVPQSTDNARKNFQWVINHANNDKQGRSVKKAAIQSLKSLD